jgi:hypothetical protein
MTGWEHIEFSLSRLYSIFVGDPDGQSLVRYGARNIFRERLKILREAANSYFVAHPDQELEGAFDEIASTVEGFANRRNDVAHCVVMPINKFTAFRDRFDDVTVDGPKQYLLFPPLYLIRKADAQGLPSFAYSFDSLMELAGRLAKLGEALSYYRKMLLERMPGRPPT